MRCALYACVASGGRSRGGGLGASHAKDVNLSMRIRAHVRAGPSLMTAARVTPGAICLSNSSHFPPRLYSNRMKPVALPPGRARASTNSPTVTDRFMIISRHCWFHHVHGSIPLP